MVSGSRRLGVLPVAFFLIGASAQAAIPAAERQVLLSIYNQTDGSNWVHNGGWNNGQGGMGAAGSECGGSNAPPWYGVSCDSGGNHVVGIDLQQNGLVGTLPDLSALTYLQTFIVSNNNNCSSSTDKNCGLGGTIPSLSALTGLQGFSIEGDQFTGSIPSLSGLIQLRGFDVAGNNLGGPLPSLAGLVNLQGFNAAKNSLSGSLPSLSGLTSLTVFDVDNNALTGSIPSLSGLTNLQAFYVFDNQLSGSIPSLSGLSALQFFNAGGNQLSGAIPALGGLANLATFNVHGNQLNGALPSLIGLSALTGIDVGGNQLTGVVPVAPNPNNLQAGASVLCGNAFTATPDANWDAATGTVPWYGACGLSATSVNLDQQGLTGAWGRANTPGTYQGFLFDVFPDNVAPGHGTAFAGWYTYDVAGGSGGQRWYALQGDVYSNSSSALLGIYTRSGGNLNSGSSPPVVQVGTATLSFSSCSTGMLVYAFDDGRAGSIPLSRVGDNTTCGGSGNNGVEPANSKFSGGWGTPNASGMGFVIDIIPSQTILFGSWYTFYPAGNLAPSPRQQWFVFSDSNFAPTATATSSSNVPLLQPSGGSFDATVGGGVTMTTVGSVSLNFTSCTTAKFTYAISTESVNTTTVDLVRLSPAPAGCTFP